MFRHRLNSLDEYVDSCAGYERFSCHNCKRIKYACIYRQLYRKIISCELEPRELIDIQRTIFENVLELQQEEKKCDYFDKADKIIEFNSKGKMLGAICAAPTVFGGLGILEGKKACCYPGMEDGLTGAQKCTDNVIVDGNIITSRGVGTAIDFALAIIPALVDKKTADDIAEGIVYKR